MEQITRGQAVRVGVDLSKRVIQVHAVDAGGRVLCSRALVRDKFIAWCAQLPAGCVVATPGARAPFQSYQMCSALPKAARTLSCIISDRVGCGKIDCINSASVVSSVLPTT